MRKVVCNTTPILSLLKIGQLHLLKDMYGEIIIPRAVFDEIEVGKNWKYYIDLNKEGWIKIQNVRDAVVLDLLLDLDRGEAEDYWDLAESKATGPHSICEPFAR